MPYATTTEIVAGAVVLLILKEIFAFILPLLKSKNGGEPSAGGRPTEFWINANREIMSKALMESVVPILQQQAKILDEMRQAAIRNSEVLMKMQFLNERIDESVQAIVKLRSAGQ